MKLKRSGYLNCAFPLLLILIFVDIQMVTSMRTKRNLIFPPPKAKIQMIFGIGIPVSLQDKSVTLGYVAKAQYFLPANSSYFTEETDILHAENRGMHTRWHIYEIMSNILERFGGKSCVLRSICEFAYYGLQREQGYLEELLYVIFRPSTTFDVLSNPMDKDYISAERLANILKGKCKDIYPCKISLMDFVIKFK